MFRRIDFIKEVKCQTAVSYEDEKIGFLVIDNQDTIQHTPIDSNIIKEWLDNGNKISPAKSYDDILNDTKESIIQSIKDYYSQESIRTISIFGINIICDKNSYNYFKSEYDYCVEFNVTYSHVISYTPKKVEVNLSIENLKDIIQSIKEKRKLINELEQFHISCIKNITSTKSKKSFDKTLAEVKNYDFKYYEDK